MKVIEKVSTEEIIEELRKRDCQECPYCHEKLNIDINFLIGKRLK